MLLSFIIINLYLFSVFTNQYWPISKHRSATTTSQSPKKGGDFIHGSVVDLPPKSVASPPDSPDGSWRPWRWRDRWDVFETWRFELYGEVMWSHQKFPGVGGQVLGDHEHIMPSRFETNSSHQSKLDERNSEQLVVSNMSKRSISVTTPNPTCAKPRHNRSFDRHLYP